MSRPLDLQMLGYDARIAPEVVNPKRCWTPFLLRSASSGVVSTDDSVWWSALDDLGHLMPHWTGPFQGLWESLASLQAFVAEHQDHIEKPYWIAAVARVRDTRQEERLGAELGYSFTYENIVPAEPEESWEFLGFDVSDYFQLSALSNCGYAPEDARQGEEFASSLNEYHLFDDLPAATKFQAWADRRVPEHSPFFVYALFKVGAQSLGGGGHPR